MVEVAKNENLSDKKELLEKQLKELNDLKAQILKWKKEWEKEQELSNLNQEIAKIEKELLMVKFQELKALKEQGVQLGRRKTMSNNFWYDIPDKKDKPVWVRLTNFDKKYVLDGVLISLSEEKEKCLVLNKLKLHLDLKSNFLY